jgi:hypothetical protein
MKIFWQIVPCKVNPIACNEFSSLSSLNSITREYFLFTTRLNLPTRASIRLDNVLRKSHFLDLRAFLCNYIREGSSENCKINNLKVVIDFAKYLMI